MKVLRKFEFIPVWNSRGFSYESTKDLYSLPEFNVIAKMLNDKGWEIKQFNYIEDKSTYHKTDMMQSLEIYCEKNGDNFKEEKDYCYVMTKNGLIDSQTLYDDAVKKSNEDMEEYLREMKK